MTADLRAHLETSLGSTYSIERELGGGGMSRVFVATETRLGRRVVVKVLNPDVAHGVSAERFEREVRMAAGRPQIGSAVRDLTPACRNGMHDVMRPAPATPLAAPR